MEKKAAIQADFRSPESRKAICAARIGIKPDYKKKGILETVKLRFFVRNRATLEMIEVRGIQ